MLLALNCGAPSGCNAAALGSSRRQGRQAGQLSRQSRHPQGRARGKAAAASGWSNLLSQSRPLLATHSSHFSRAAKCASQQNAALGAPAAGCGAAGRRRRRPRPAAGLWLEGARPGRLHRKVAAHARQSEGQRVVRGLDRAQLGGGRCACCGPDRAGLRLWLLILVTITGAKDGRKFTTKVSSWAALYSMLT